MEELDKVFQRCEDVWGKEMQMMMCIEECAELQKALIKYFRDPDNNKEEIAEELADVAIMIAQIRYTMRVGEEYEKFFGLKMAELMRKLEEAGG